MKGIVFCFFGLCCIGWQSSKTFPPAVALSPVSVADSSKYPQNYFRPPLDLPLALAGNFGEPRKGHFHTGLDFRTNSEEGHAVLAAADGYISRINVSSTGYGNALFITHPNGYTTVYGHLREFVPPLMERLRKEQYAKKEFAVDIFLKPGEFQFKQGDTIAYSGSTGASGGPHLHFEIRDLYERPINPLLFGFNIVDDKHTVVKAVKLYAMDDKKYTSEGFTVKLVQKDTVYHVPGGVVNVNASQVGIAANVYDLINQTDNYIGVYDIKLFEQGKLIYQYRMDRLSFAETRYVLSQVDYPEFLENRLNMFNRCFVEPGNKCPVYHHLVNRGIVDLSDGKPHDIKIEVSDFAGNVSTIRFRLFYDKKSTAFKPSELKYKTVFYPDKENEFTVPEFKIKVPANGLFDTVYFNYSASLATESSIYSKVHQVDKPATQAFQWFTLSLKTERLSPHLRDKAVLVYKDPEGGEVSRGGKYDNGFITGKGREFGAYYIKIDTTPPTITPLIIPTAKNPHPPKWTFKIDDNLSGIAHYDTYLDGNWVETDYDAKSYTLIHTPAAHLAPGRHTFKVVVRDERDNTAAYEASFKL